MARSVTIMYGFAEGFWHGRSLRKELRLAGFRYTKDTQNADIIIAHSGACYLVPRTSRAYLVMHVGYAYWPGKPLLSSLLRALVYDKNTHSFLNWIGRCVVHDLYMLNVFHTIRMIPGWHSPTHKLDTLTEANHIFVQGEYDPYCKPEALIRATGGARKYISMPDTGHDGLWDSPTQYVNLLQSVI